MNPIRLYTEYDGENIRGFRYNKENSIEFTTKRQRVCILDTLLFGKTLFLDGCLQSSLKDEEIYHRKLVHPVLGLAGQHKEAQSLNVCVIGGGEGATVREILKHSTVKSVTMIDWDEELVEYMKTNEPSWHKGALHDSRVTCEFCDIFDIIDESRQYDVIIMDLVDPDMEDLKWQILYIQIVKWLTPNGYFITNAGGIYPWDCTTVDKIQLCLEEGCRTFQKQVRFMRHKCFVPSFGREWAFLQFNSSD